MISEIKTGSSVSVHTRRNTDVKRCTPLPWHDWDSMFCVRGNDLQFGSSFLVLLRRETSSQRREEWDVRLQNEPSCFRTTRFTTFKRSFRRDNRLKVTFPLIGLSKMPNYHHWLLWRAARLNNIFWFQMKITILNRQNNIYWGFDKILIAGKKCLI